jgi:hypothetical protein
VGSYGYPHSTLHQHYLNFFKMGSYGYPHRTYKYTDYLINEYRSPHLGLILDTQFDVQTPLLLSGVEWIYSWIESAITFSITILYESTLAPTDITALEHFILSHDYRLSTFLFICVIQDLQNISATIVLPYISNWYNYIHVAANNAIFHIEHPEINYFYNRAIIDVVAPYISKIQFVIELETLNEGIILIPFVLLDLIWKIVLFSIFVLFFMHWYNITVNSENVDSDFLVNSLSIESEEEIASLDDTVLLLIVIFFIFGWFFFLIT